MTQEMLDKISKLVQARYRHPDNMIGKELILKLDDRIKPFLKKTKNRIIIAPQDLRKLGYDIGTKSSLQFEKDDFPELWE